MKKILSVLFNVSISVLILYINIFSQTVRSDIKNVTTKRFERVENITLKNQTSTNFFPNKDGDFWEYIEEDTTTLFTQFLNLKFSVSREVFADTLMSNGFIYKKVKWQNEANSVNYLPTFEYLRVDSIGNAHIHYNTTDFILFDFTLEVNQTYTAHLFNHYWKVLDKYGVIGFGDTLQAVDFGLYDQNSIMTEIYSIVENFGIIFYQNDLLNYALPLGNFWGAVISGQEYGTLIVKKQTVDWKEFYPLHIGDYWVYEGFSGSIPVTNSVRVIGDTIMPDNNNYFVLREIDHTFGYITLSYRRIDSFGKVFYWEPWDNSAKQYFEFSKNVGDSLKNKSNGFVYRLDNKYINNKTGLFELNNLQYPDISYTQNDYDLRLGLFRETGEMYLSECIGAYINGEMIWGDTTISSIEENYLLNPKEFILSPCYPNPFNSSTMLQYYVPSPTNVEIDVYNLIGQSLISIFNDFMPTGYHKQKIELNGLSAGVYFVVVNAGNQKLVNKIIYLK